MSYLGWIMYGTVALWLAPGSLWRPVAVALLAEWYIAEVNYLFFKDFEPLTIYYIGDAAVVFTVVFFHSHWSEWLILSPYPLVWWLYEQPETQAQWAALYWIALIQFILAGPWPQTQRVLGSNTHGSLKEHRYGEV